MIPAASNPFFLFLTKDQLTQIGEKEGKVIWAMPKRLFFVPYNIHITFHIDFNVLDGSWLCLVPRVSSKNFHFLESNSP